MTNKLRIGVLLDDFASLHGWELHLFDRISRETDCEITCLLFAPPAPQPSPVRSIDAMVYGLVTGLDRWLLGAQQEFDTTDIRAQLASLPRIRLEGGSPKPAADQPPARLEVILDHAGAPLSPDVHALARHGVWRLEPANEHRASAELATFRESLEGAPAIGVTLKRLDPRHQRDTILARAYFNFKPSFARNRDMVWERSERLLLRELRRLARTGVASDEPALADEPTARPLGPTPTPAALATLQYGGRVAGRIARRALDQGLARIGYRPQMWTLFFGHGPIEQADLSRLAEARPGRNELWADPFLFRHNGDDYVFFENYDYATRLGRISVGILSGDELNVLGDALVRDHHLSYPYIFEDAGEIYMMPETYNSGRIEVWRCRSFPLDWELHATAFEGRRAVDSILYKDQPSGKWWLFTSLAEGDQHDFSELHVFAVDGPSLTGITPHTLNPVVMDCRTARNGGRVFRRDGRLYRSSQNNSHGVYGWGLNLMEISRLDLDHYEEAPVFSLTPDRVDGIVACHHMDMLADRFVIDGCRRFGGF